MGYSASVLVIVEEEDSSFEEYDQLLAWAEVIENKQLQRNKLYASR